MKNHILFLMMFALLVEVGAQKNVFKTQANYLRTEAAAINTNYSANLDSLATTIMQNRHIPGMAAAIVKENKIIWEGYYGYANIAENHLVDTNTIFMLASISKTVTGAALMKLFESGYFELDDSINSYLPFTVRNPNHPSIPITFRQLLTHSSSINDNFSYYFYYWGTDPLITLGYYLENYLVPGGLYYSNYNYSSSAPGTLTDYSNIGAALCGYLVETISGKPFNIFCRDSFFIPLNLTNTGWFLSELDTPKIAHPYNWNGSSFSDMGHYGIASYPDGQLRTTARSLSKWLLTNLNYGKLNGVQVLDSNTIQQMRTIQNPLLDPGLGLIWWKYQLNQRWLWGHDGEDFGVCTHFSLDEEKRTGIVLLLNISANNNIWAGLGELAIEMYNFGDNYTVGIDNDIYNLLIPDYKLETNFPNPFNPSTTIKYQISNAGLVQLKIYDVLGREVATLVDAEKSAGSYKVDFDASSLSSGVYFYQLKAGEFVSTKKMILMK